MSNQISSENKDMENISTFDKTAHRWWVIALVLSMIVIGVPGGILFTALAYMFFRILNYGLGN